MLIEIPDNIINKSNLTEKELRIEFALILFDRGIMTLEQASNFAILDSLEFQRLLGERKISIHYNENDFEEDLETIKKLLA
jgi:predicted HTH domain antitoxin